MFVLGGKRTSTMFKNRLNQKLKLIVEGARIGLYSNTTRYANAFWAQSVTVAKTPIALRNKSIWRLLRFERRPFVSKRRI